MIGKITIGSSFAGLAAYLHGPGRANEHAYDGIEGGQVIGGSLLYDGETEGRRWSTDMHDAAKLRPDIERPVWHLSLRAAPEDPTLTDTQWRDLAQGVAERMGWAEHPWVMVRHGEDHVHVVLSRVDFEGRVWSRSNDRRTLRTACMKAEVEHGLRRTPARSSEKTMRRADHQLTQGEHRRGVRTGQTPARIELAHRVRAARDVVAQTGGGRQMFEQTLTGFGVEYRANVARTGRMNGYSFHLPGYSDAAGGEVWMTASQLDRGLSWAKLAPVLAAPEVRVQAPEPPAKRLLESRTAYGERVYQADRAATQAHVRASLTRGVQTTRQDTQALSKWWGRAHLAHRMKIAGVQLVAKERNQLAEIKRLHALSFPDRPVPGAGVSRGMTAGAQAVARRLDPDHDRRRNRGYSR